MILHISDGGPNDADSERDPNGIVVSLVAPGNAVSENPAPDPDPDPAPESRSSGGGGSADLWLLLLLASMLLVTRTLTTRGRCSIPKAQH